MEESPTTGGGSPAQAAPECLHVLERQGDTIYLIGTAHVSLRSVAEVQQIIDQVRPDAVVVELCKSRMEALENPDRWKNTNVYHIVKEGRGMLLLSSLLLSAFQKKIGEKLGVQPGAEMLAAMATYPK